MPLPDKKITIISGHYGTGKTELAVNLALAMAREGRKTALVDLDIVNPYFRSYERRALLEASGVRVLVTSQGGRADTPALPADIMSVFADPDLQTIIDLGGDPIGARVLGYYKDQLDQAPFDFWFAVNQKRPENKSPELVMAYLQETERLSRQKITGLVNTSHLGSETSLDDILSGDAYVAELASILALPLVYTVGERHFQDDLQGRTKGPFFPIDLYMVKPWELGQAEGGLFEWQVE